MPAAGADTHLLLRTFVDELGRCGVADACTSPGSRSAPIVLAFVRSGTLRCHSHLDERCAGFFAVGLAGVTGRPVAITCTSGTATANLLPAVVEAFHARLPLVVLTADRPAELREIGAGQAIDQIHLFGTAAKWFFEVGTHEATPARMRWMRALACRAVWTAQEGRPGPVHLNFPLREPLVPPGELGDDPVPGRANGRPWLRRHVPEGTGHAAADALRAAAGSARRGVIVAGSVGTPAAGAALAARAEELGWPLLSDPLGGARRGAAAIAHYDALLRVDAFTGTRAPDVVVRVGDLPTSKPLRAWLEAIDDAVPQIALDPRRSAHDPPGKLHLILAADPAKALAALSGDAPTDPAWLASWRGADAQAAQAIDSVIGEELSEPLVARELCALLGADATLFVASSMPIRDVESFAPIDDDGPRVLANRGANGIDGTVSSAFGAAAASPGPTALLIGDVALAHDIGGLLAARRLGLSLTVVVVHNDGGGIFEFLPIAGEHDAFQEHVATPHGLDFAHAAALYGCAHTRPKTVAQLREAVDGSVREGGVAIVEVRTDRIANRDLHRRIDDAVAEALG